MFIMFRLDKFSILKQIKLVISYSKRMPNSVFVVINLVFRASYIFQFLNVNELATAFITNIKHNLASLICYFNFIFWKVPEKKMIIKKDSPVLSLEKHSKVLQNNQHDKQGESKIQATEVCKI